MKLKPLIAALAAGLVFPGVAGATNGYFSHGYGMKAKGMAGVGIALPQDAVAAATNPAGMAFVGNRLDLGIEIFRPIRDASIAGNVCGPGCSLDGNYSGSGTKNFYVPEAGYNRMLNDRLALGVSVYGNGGMNTTYKTNPFAPFGASSPAGVDLVQLFVAPTLAYKITPDHAVGVSLNLAHQRFAMDGIEPFTASSGNPAKMTGNGDDDSSGWGVRVGWTGKVSPMVTLGATYQSKTRMSRFKKYEGLFAEQGDFDIPANYGVGIAVQATPALTIAADIQQIDYSDVRSVGSPVAKLFAGNPFGSSDGPGFGWRDMTVFKLGASYQLNKNLVLRGGVSHGRQPIPSAETFLNTLAPGVIEDHLTLGATWTLANGHELTVGYMHAFKKTVNGSGSIPAPFGGGEANIKMYQDSLGVGYGIRM
ncbi:MAG: outer membrane protein transport protein [Rhodocyclaceae bacterium]